MEKWREELSEWGKSDSMNERKCRYLNVWTFRKVLCIAYKYIQHSWSEHHPQRINELHIESYITFKTTTLVRDRKKNIDGKDILHSLCSSYPLHSCFFFALISSSSVSIKSSGIDIVHCVWISSICCNTIYDVYQLRTILQPSCYTNGWCCGQHSKHEMH